MVVIRLLSRGNYMSRPIDSEQFDHSRHYVSCGSAVIVVVVYVCFAVVVIDLTTFT